jgi:lysophospholipase L1-like esterase
MKNADVKILFLGASIMEGWRSVATALWKDVLEPAGALNLGIPGETSGQLLWRLQNNFLRGLAPHTVVFQVGANDRTVDAAGVAQNIADTVALIRTQLPHARVLVFGILPTDLADSATRRKNALTNQLLAPLVDGDRVQVLDVGDLFVDAAGGLRPDLLPDGLHPSARAYAQWAQRLFPLLGLPAP